MTKVKQRLPIHQTNLAVRDAPGYMHATECTFAQEIQAVVLAGEPVHDHNWVTVVDVVDGGRRFAICRMEAK